MVFGINSTTSQEATGSANDRFMERSTGTLLPNSYNPELKTGELIEKRIANHEKRITKKNSNNKILYQIGDRVRLQNIVTKEFKLFGTITNLRLADDGAVVTTQRGINDPNITNQNNKMCQNRVPLAKLK